MVSSCDLATAFIPVNTQLSWHKTKGTPRYVWDVGYVVIHNGTGTEWSPIRPVIIQVLNKIGRARSMMTNMITDRIGRQEVLLPINHNHFNFRKSKYIKSKYLQWRQRLLFKILPFWKFPSFSWDKWLLLWLLWSFLWLVD